MMLTNSQRLPQAEFALAVEVAEQSTKGQSRHDYNDWQNRLAVVLAAPRPPSLRARPLQSAQKQRCSWRTTLPTVLCKLACLPQSECADFFILESIHTKPTLTSNSTSIQPTSASQLNLLASSIPIDVDRAAFRVGVSSM